ncbi:Arylphorin subunit A4 [Lucilia cuprina]|nr:Arylphorin subunit A4 [Lucilia cuprina]
MVIPSKNFFQNTAYILPIWYFGGCDQAHFEVYPHVFLNYETMMRDPLFYMFYKKILRYTTNSLLSQTLTHEELLVPWCHHQGR